MRTEDTGRGLTMPGKMWILISRINWTSQSTLTGRIGGSARRGK